MSETTELARRFMEEAWGGNVALADELVASDAEAPHDGQFPAGPEGWKQEIELIRSGLPDLRVEVVETVEEGDAVAVHWRSRGTHSGTLFGIPPTGKEIGIDGLSMFHVRDGKLTRHFSLEDRFSLMAQLGLFPTAAHTNA